MNKQLLLPLLLLLAMLGPFSQASGEDEGETGVMLGKTIGLMAQKWPHLAEFG